jgi:hypothetical protein
MGFGDDNEVSREEVVVAEHTLHIRHFTIQLVSSGKFAMPSRGFLVCQRHVVSLFIDVTWYFAL